MPVAVVLHLLILDSLQKLTGMWRERGTLGLKQNSVKNASEFVFFLGKKVSETFNDGLSNFLS